MSEVITPTESTIIIKPTSTGFLIVQEQSEEKET